MASSDEQWESGGITRADLLRARGYDETEVAGHNGHALRNGASEPSLNDGSAGQIEDGSAGSGNGHAPRPEMNVTGPACVICSGAIPERRAASGGKTCGDRCSEQHRRQRRVASAGRKESSASDKARASSRSPGAAPTMPPEVPAPAVATNGAPPPIRGGLAPAGDLFAHAEALCRAFGASASVEVRSGPLSAVFTVTHR